MLLSFVLFTILSLAFATPVVSSSPWKSILKRQTTAAQSITANAALSIANGRKKPPPGDGSPGGIFNGIRSSPNLQFQPCLNLSFPISPGEYYNNTFQCARLEVPLDYSKPNGDIFKLAVLKLPAINPNSTFKGAFFMNQFFTNNVDFSITGLPADYQLSGFDGFDFYAFDIRGTGHSTPQLSCFAGEDEFNAYALQSYDNDNVFGAFNGTFPPSEANIKGNIQTINPFMAQFGNGCVKNYGKYLPYISSADHARDLNNIVSQLQKGTFINIYNYGYSTVLGATYAAMYPNSFDRMVMDGTVDAQKVWKSGDNDLVAIQDANKAVQAFFDSCAASTPCTLDDVNVTDPGSFPVGDCAGCYFWANTSAGVQARFEALLAKYYYKPFKSSVTSPVCGDCNASYDFIYHSLGIDQPADYIQFAMMSSLRLLEWEMGRALPGGAIEWFATNYPANVTFYPPEIAQWCVDQGSAVQGLANIETYMKSMNSSYNGLGPGGTARREMWCSNWPAAGTAKNPYTGFKTNAKIRTKGAMLFLANDMDGRNSLANAQSMSDLFTNSAVLTVNEMGDTSFFSGNPSTCVGNYEAPFTVSGTLPPAGAFCNDVTDGPFGVGYQKNYRS